MNVRDEHLAGVLCHCDQTAELPEDGHPLGAPGCATKITPGRCGDGWCSSDHYGSNGCNRCHGPARGTCPECGEQSRVVKIRPIRSDTGRALFGAAAPGMAPHKAGGQECPGTGKVPTETTFTSGRALVEWLATRAREVAA